MYTFDVSMYNAYIWSVGVYEIYTFVCVQCTDLVGVHNLHIWVCVMYTFVVYVCV